MGGALIVLTLYILVMFGVLADDVIKHIKKHFTDKEVNRIKAQYESRHREWLRNSWI